MPEIRINKTEYLDEHGLNALWDKIKDYVSENGGSGGDGFSPVATVEQTEDGAVITITDKAGTTTAIVSNGIDGQNGTDGINGIDGENGQDGFSPTITENSENNETVYRLDITTSNNTFTTPNLKGADGAGGEMDLSDYALKSELPTKLSELQNDVNYLRYQEVSALPGTQEEGVLYLVTG